MDHTTMKDTDGWWTPITLVVLAMQVFGDYQDPCGDIDARSPLSQHAKAVNAGVGFFGPWTPDLPAVINPPWSSAGRFVRRAAQVDVPKLYIVPARLDTLWSYEARPQMVLTPPSRVRYLDPKTGKVAGSPRTSTMILISDINEQYQRAMTVASQWAARHNWRAWRR